MIGKIFIDKEWKLVDFDENKKILKILKSENIEKPLRLKYELSDKNLLCAYMENDSFYVFDYNSGQKCEAFFEFEQEKIKNINYFVLPRFPFSNISNDNSFKKVTFVNGALKSIISSADSKELSFDVSLNGIKLNIKFYIEEEKNYVSYKAVNGMTMLTNLPNVANQYKLEVSFYENVDIEKLNCIIENIYKFISFLSFMQKPYIEKIQVENSTCKLNYFYDKINYNEFHTSKYAYVGNFRDKCKNLLEVISDPIINLDFLDTLNSLDCLNIRDIWKLANSIEAIAEDEISPESDFAKQIQYNLEFSSKVRTLIKEFKNEGKLEIDGDQENSIISCLKITNFRKKIHNLIEKYNKFARCYEKYNEITESDAQKFSKRLSELRNTIHGNKVDFEDGDTEICIVMIFSLYLAILEKSKFDTSQEFNLLQSLF